MMEKYRITVKHRMVWQVVGGLLAVALVAGSILVTLNDYPGDTGTFWDGYVRGVPLGIFMAFCAFLVIGIVQCARALKNGDRLKAMYIKENDELAKAIQQKALGTSYFFTSGVLIVGLTVASRFSNLVAVVLTAVAIVHVLGGSVLQLYYRHKLT